MICGIDESGRGPVVGPLVIAGVKIEDEFKILKYDIKDSKKLRPKKRQYLANRIMKIVEKYKTIVIPARDIDDMRKTFTLNEIEVFAFAQIINELKPKICYVDSADVNEKRFGNNILSNLSYRPKMISRHKADSIFPIVSAASILAKVKRDEEIMRISKQLEKKINLPLGSGYPSDIITKKFILSWFDKYNELPPHTRHSWKTAQNILKEKHNKKIGDF
jgi:ribonuclease HII